MYSSTFEPGRGLFRNEKLSFVCKKETKHSDHATHRLKKKHFSLGFKHEQRLKNLRVQTSFVEKLKAEGSVTFQNIFSSLALLDLTPEDNAVSKLAFP